MHDTDDLESKKKIKQKIVEIEKLLQPFKDDLNKLEEIDTELSAIIREKNSNPNINSHPNMNSSSIVIGAR